MTAFTTVTHPALRGRTREQASVQARRRPFLPGEATGSFWILAAVVDWARDAGRTPYLHVTEGNATARAVYVDAGFEPTGTWEPLREGSPLRIEEMVLRRG